MNAVVFHGTPWNFCLQNSMENFPLISMQQLHGIPCPKTYSMEFHRIPLVSMEIFSWSSMEFHGVISPFLRWLY